jgi:hypothetical protein
MSAEFPGGESQPPSETTPAPLRAMHAGATITIQLRRGLCPSEKLRRMGQASRAADVGARATTLAARLGVSGASLQRVWEPYLLRRGLVVLTPLGRALASTAA